MGKLKRANCGICSQSIKRHDAKRVEHKVLVLNTRPGYRTIVNHLSCEQDSE